MRSSPLHPYGGWQSHFIWAVGTDFGQHCNSNGGALCPKNFRVMAGLTCPVCFIILIFVSAPVWLMPATAEATTAKEPIDEKADGQSLPRLRPSCPAGASPALPLPGAA